MGEDELQPLSRRGKNSFGGLGATIVDSLDTLWMLGLKEEFGRARDWVADELSFNKCATLQRWLLRQDHAMAFAVWDALLGNAPNTHVFVEPATRQMHWCMHSMGLS